MNAQELKSIDALGPESRDLALSKLAALVAQRGKPPTLSRPDPHKSDFVEREHCLGVLLAAAGLGAAVKRIAQTAERSGAFVPIAVEARASLTAAHHEIDVQALACLMLLQYPERGVGQMRWLHPLARTRLQSLLLQYPVLMHPTIHFDTGDGVVSSMARTIAWTPAAELPTAAMRGAPSERIKAFANHWAVRADLAELPRRGDIVARRAGRFVGSLLALEGARDGGASFLGEGTQDRLAMDSFIAASWLDTWLITPAANERVDWRRRFWSALQSLPPDRFAAVTTAIGQAVFHQTSATADTLPTLARVAHALGSSGIAPQGRSVRAQNARHAMAFRFAFPRDAAASPIRSAQMAAGSPADCVRLIDQAQAWGIELDEVLCRLRAGKDESTADTGWHVAIRVRMTEKLMNDTIAKGRACRANPAAAPANQKAPAVATRRARML